MQNCNCKAKHVEMLQPFIILVRDSGTRIRSGGSRPMKEFGFKIVTPRCELQGVKAVFVSFTVLQTSEIPCRPKVKLMEVHAGLSLGFWLALS